MASAPRTYRPCRVPCPALRPGGDFRYHARSLFPGWHARLDRAPMPEIRPFRGVRYDLAKVGALSEVVAPPYDVIGPGLQETLYNASPYNIIRLELNRDEPGDKPGHDRYARASATLKDWRRQAVLAEDP